MKLARAAALLAGCSLAAAAGIRHVKRWNYDICLNHCSLAGVAMPDQNTFGLPLENFWSEQCPPIIVSPFNASAATSTVCLTFSGPALHFTFAPFPGYTTQHAFVTWKVKGNLDTSGNWTTPPPTANISCAVSPEGVATCDLPFYNITQMAPSTPIRDLMAGMCPNGDREALGLYLEFSGQVKGADESVWPFVQQFPCTSRAPNRSCTAWNTTFPYIEVAYRCTNCNVNPCQSSASCNTPSNRACWSPGFDINTDYEAKTPTTGVTRPYTLTLTEADNWTGPDGVVKKKVMLVNGKILGPTIVANWGDWIEVTVINNLRTNGTSIHWHGMRQMGTNFHDGANGVTECPIPPQGGTRVYRFRAQQYGSSWYHSHFSAQYSNGVVGTIQINGPASLPYDIDLGVFPLTDYYYKTADELVLFTQNNGPPFSDNVLFNGTAKHPTTGAGEYANVTLTPGKRHRLRLINTSSENHFQVSLANHNMTIIASDLVPVNAMTVDSLFLAVGQRYDVIIDASRTPDNYWFNVTFGGSNFCGNSVNPNPAAIFHYAGAPGGLPTDPGATPVDHQCLDLPNLTPVVARTVPVSGFVKKPSNTLPVHLDLTGTPLFVWKVNGSSMNVDWNKPVLDYVLTQNTSYPTGDNVVQVDVANQWTYWLIENDPDGGFALPHPMHLHGHDFYVLGRSPDTPPSQQQRYVFDPATDLAGLHSVNPVRRDVTILPAKGWLLLAFKSDNPGAWLFHCHIAWHVSGGLSVQFLEQATALRTGMPAADKSEFNRLCTEWRAYWPTNPFPKVDSGLRMRWVEESEWMVKA